MPSEIQNTVPAPIDPAVLEQFTGQTVIRDTADAQRQCVAAEAMAKTAVGRLRKAKRVVLYRRVRLLTARWLGAPWVSGLVAGSIAAVVLGATAGVVFGAREVFFVGIMLLAYAAFGGGALWLLRDLDGEDDHNRVQIRTGKLEIACHQRDVARDAVRHEWATVAKARQLLELLQKAEASEANRRQNEINRLLSIDPGRLYPDEFERYVADIFRHLGYTVEVTGKGGDQGVDVLAQKGSLSLAIQAKRYIGAVGNAAVQEVFAGMHHYKCQRCVVVTPATFTSGAVDLAQSTGCVLIAKDQIGALVRGELAF